MGYPLIRRLLLALFLTVFTGCGDTEKLNIPPVESSPQTYDMTIVALGDSLTEGLGVDEDRAYPAILEQRLRSDGFSVRVVNAGISGETSSGALSRVNWIMTLDPDIVILETGANDGLRGIDPTLTAGNIEKMLIFFKKNGVGVVLAGMKMVTNLGEPFLKNFEAIFTGAAREYGVILIPFFLEGVAGVSRLNQPDGIHPTGEGYRNIVNHMYPYVIKAIQRKQTAP